MLTKCGPTAGALSLPTSMEHPFQEPYHVGMPQCNMCLQTYHGRCLSPQPQHPTTTPPGRTKLHLGLSFMRQSSKSSNKGKTRLAEEEEIIKVFWHSTSEKAEMLLSSPDFITNVQTKIPLAVITEATCIHDTQGKFASITTPDRLRILLQAYSAARQAGIHSSIQPPVQDDAAETLASYTGTHISSARTMLNRLHAYAQRKHLIINPAKSEVVHCNSSGPDLPVFRIGGVPLAHKESFKYLGMMFHKCMSMAKSSEHAAGPFMASASRVRQFVREKFLANRPYVSWEDVCGSSWNVCRPSVGH
eukprot:1152643-Pelagomonas_calceolata.AAC.2